MSRAYGAGKWIEESAVRRNGRTIGCEERIVRCTVKTCRGVEGGHGVKDADGDISIEDMIPSEEVVVMISHLGYIKRTKVAEYRIQGRGGRGSRGGKTRNEDFIEHVFIANTHNYLMLFTEQGRCHWLKVYEIPEASKTSSGRVLQNILSIPKDDKVKAYINVEDLKNEDFLENNFIIFCTKRGLIKKTKMKAFSRPRANGIQAITINEGDQLLEVKLTNGSNEILIANRQGRAIRFPEAKVRAMGRTAAGVRGISLGEDDDAVVGMICVDPNDLETTIMVVSEKGNGKRSNLDDYRITNRGGKGVKTMQITDKTGKLVTIKSVKDGDDIMITNKSGIVIRMSVADIRTMGRATQGVRVIRLDEDDDIADVAVISFDDDDSEGTPEGEQVQDES